MLTIEEYVTGLHCDKVKPGDRCVLEKLNRFNCGSPDKKGYPISCNMLDRFKKYIMQMPWNQEIYDVYYIIHDEENIYLFFSLQTSLIYSNVIASPEDIGILIEAYNLTKKSYGTIFNYSDYQSFLNDLDEVPEKYKHLEDNKSFDLFNKVEKIIKCSVGENQNNLYVNKVFPSIEMVNFCKNHIANDEWNIISGGNIPLSAALFWYNVLPIIKQVCEKIGCEYVSLFAADNTDKKTDGKMKLLSYYKNVLMFEQLVDINAIKPYYDWECIFLCQKIEELCDKELSFKQNFLSGCSENDV